jgi:uncharacterized protein
MTAPTDRIPTLDVLRGCAIMGILWMNITAFAFPPMVYVDPAAAGPLSWGDTLFWAISFVAVDGKMRGLLSILFGASMLLLIDREEMAGRNGARAQIVRSGWLFVIGLAHYLLLFWGDILMTYALVGLVALLFVRQEPLALLRTAFLAFLLHFLFCAGFVGMLYAWSRIAVAPDASTALSEGFAQFAGSMTDPNHPAFRNEVAIYRGGYAGILAEHLANYPREWLWTFLLSCLDTMGFMLLGMAMLKGGFLTGRWEAGQYWRTARHCFLIGLPPMIALAIWIVTTRFAPLATFGAFLAWSFPFRIPLTVGWAALILWLALRYRDSAAAGRIAAVGRMALSNYLGTSLVMTAIFYGWGGGLFARVPLAALPLFVLAGWAAMLLWSTLWQRRFILGPAEWLWRSLQMRQPQKIRINR